MTTGFHQAIIDAGFSSLWTCQEASGDLQDVIGGRTLVASGSGATYSVAGGPTGAPNGVTIPSTATFTATANTTLDLGGIFSILAVVKKADTSTFLMLNKGPGDTSGYSLAHVSNLMRLRTSYQSVGDLGGFGRVRQTTADTSTAVEQYMFSRDGATGAFQLDATDDTTVSDATVMTDNASSLVVGGVEGSFTLYTLAFHRGVAVSDATWQTIYDARDTGETGGSSGSGRFRGFIGAAGGFFG